MAQQCGADRRAATVVGRRNSRVLRGSNALFSVACGPIVGQSVDLTVKKAVKLAHFVDTQAGLEPVLRSIERDLVSERACLGVPNLFRYHISPNVMPLRNVRDARETFEDFLSARD